MKMSKRIYGVVGIKSIMANWNADITGCPKTTSDGNIFGSDKALKYPIKKMWQTEGEKVLYIKSLKISEKSKKGDNGEKLQPRNLNEQYVDLFGAELTKKTPSLEVLKNLFMAIDVMNFGAVFAEEGNNIGITGAVQIGQGFNKYEDTSVEIVDILSPFRNSNKDKEGAQACSMGKKIVANEAHYFYPFSINPQNYDDFEKLGVPEFEGYTVEAYEKFKRACCIAPTAFNTNSKAGCETEFMLIITCKENSNLYLPGLDQYVCFEKKDKKSIIDLSDIETLLKDKMQDIESIEVYCNSIYVDIISNLDIQVKNLF